MVPGSGLRYKFIGGGGGEGAYEGVKGVYSRVWGSLGLAFKGLGLEGLRFRA